ncbi:hypothetical protein RJ641_003986 [Dillenia turbinata]|uniref:Uncharacterized protein n=1 Tax=Dillenia turbinata TaxID=194707 RepID=A0AAN8VM50_9MAGN
MRFLHMTLVISGSVRPTGRFSMSSLVGCSVARARAPSVSMMRFTHSNWTAVSGTSPAEIAATKLIARAATLTRRSIICTITSDRNNVAFLFQALHHEKFVKRRGSCHHTDFVNFLHSLLWGVVSELHTLYHRSIHILTRPENSAFCSYSPCSVNIVTSDHFDVHSSILAVLHGFFHPIPARNQPIYDHLSGDFSIFIFFWNLLMSKCDASKAASCHSFNYLFKLHLFFSIQSSDCTRKITIILWWQSPLSHKQTARVSVTASGKPSGIATTTMVTASAMIPITALSTSSTFVLLPLNSGFPFSSSVFPVKYRTNNTTSTRKATSKPTLPMDEVSLFKRACKGVVSSESRLIVLIISPHVVFMPTEVTSILAYPSATLVPETRKGFLLWLIST